MTETLGAFALLAWLAYVASRLLARRHLPELVGFLLVGAALGPSGFGLISASELSALRPITEVALAILMFVIGERVSRRALMAAKWTITTGVAQYVLSAIGVFAATTALGADRPVALILAALAGAGAPMTVSHIVSSAKATGSYPVGLVGTHAVSDALATTAFAAVLPVATLLNEADTDVSGAVLDFVQLGIGGIVLGLLGGWFISRLGFQIETSGELLLFVLVHILLGWSIAEWLDISLPLAALVAGATAASISPEGFAVRLFRTVRTIEQPLYLLFFALAGASIHLSDVPNVGAVGVAYIVVRVIAKILGGLFGGMLGGLGLRRSFGLGVSLTPQAGVAVGLAVLASEVLTEGGAGAKAATVVLGSVVLFELVGPLLVARDLAGSAKSSTDEDSEVAPAHSGVPERLLVASPVAAEFPEWIIGLCGRWRAHLVVMMPGEADDPIALRIQEQCAQADVDFEFVPLRSESFTGAVVRTRASTNADFVVLIAPRPQGTTSRLVLFPAERISRQLSCPVLTFPLTTAGPPEPEASRRWPWLASGHHRSSDGDS
ncbi:MAG: cation:proton antiporter [Acidimicrobiales bacterium]|jgi:Kef-type K+ transport system membrane component KefB